MQKKKSQGHHCLKNPTVICFYQENKTRKLAVSETLVMALSLITDKSKLSRTETSLTWLEYQAVCEHYGSNSLNYNLLQGCLTVPHQADFCMYTLGSSRTFLIWRLICSDFLQTLATLDVRVFISHWLQIVWFYGINMLIDGNRKECPVFKIFRN